MLILALILYSAIMVPYRVCFDDDPKGNWWTFEVSMSFAFLIDCYFNFRTAYAQTTISLHLLASPCTSHSLPHTSHFLLPTLYLRQVLP